MDLWHHWSTTEEAVDSHPQVSVCAAATNLEKVLLEPSPSPPLPPPPPAVATAAAAAPSLNTTATAASALCSIDMQNLVRYRGLPKVPGHYPV